MRDSSFSDFWRKRKARNRHLQDEGVCLVDFTLGSKRRFQVVAPHHENWVTEAIKLGGKPRSRTHVWSFHGKNAAKVIEMCKRLYPNRVKVNGYIREAPKVACTHLDTPCGPVGYGPCALCGGYSKHGNGCRNVDFKLIGFRQCSCEECAKCPKRII